MHLPTEDFWNQERQKLYDILFPEIQEALADGMKGGADLLGAIQMGLDWNLLNEWAVDFARQYTFSLVSDITQSTMSLLQNQVSTWIESGAPLSDLIGSLSIPYGDYRAFSIATTEVTRAFGNGNLAVWLQTGLVSSKEWMTAEDEIVCPICGGLDGTVVQIRGTWKGYEDSDVDTPPAHVNCRCWMRPILE